MSRRRFDGLSLLLVGSVVFIFFGTLMERISSVAMIDFKAVFYGTRCLMEHRDPYTSSDLQHIYLAEDGDTQAKKLVLVQTVVPNVNLPTTFPFVLPFALLAWGPAHILWMLLTGGSFIIATYLIWELGAPYAPILSGGLVFLFLIGSEILLEVGNTAGIVVSLCVISVWCFLQRRFEMAGTLCLAISLLIKPQDAGFIWLYFLLAGGTYRKRAFQTLLVTAIIGLPAIVWVSSVAPHWVQELHHNISVASAHGGLNDPGPSKLEPGSHGAIIISLQSAFSVLWDDARFFNAATYLLCLPLVLLWIYTSIKKGHSAANTWLALATIAALSMLPIYHRQHDTRLLLLTVPACAMLWAEGGPTAWPALSLTALGTIFTSNIPLQLLAITTTGVRSAFDGWLGKLLTLLLSRPAPLILLSISLFYLSVYVRRAALDVPTEPRFSTGKKKLTLSAEDEPA